MMMESKEAKGSVFKSSSNAFSRSLSLETVRVRLSGMKGPRTIPDSGSTPSRVAQSDKVASGAVAVNPRIMLTPNFSRTTLARRK